VEDPRSTRLLKLNFSEKNEKASIHRSNAHRSRVQYLYHNRPIQQVQKKMKLLLLSPHYSLAAAAVSGLAAAFSKVTMELLR
jgi:hypothetical protein